jgi:tRNA threonylcarbamoyladenosine biosynthesis protein TsaB
VLLAIDTSTTLTGLACYDERGLRGEAVWESGRNHATQLLPQLELLLTHLRATPSDLQALAVALGPGSWSGLRVGLSTAKGIALARSLPILGLPTLDALAHQHQRPALTVVPLIALGRGRFGTAVYHSARDTLRRQGEYASLTLDEVAASLNGRALFCGDIDAATQTSLRALLGDRARFAEPAANTRRPGFLAELAWRRFVAGERDDLAALEPIYLGQPVKTPNP